MIELPRKDKEGRSVISYSQIKMFNEAKAFGSSLTGRQAYILQYFLGIKDENGNRSFADFGIDVEDYITKREKIETFSEKERKVLDEIVPLGVFQKDIKIEFGDFYLNGFIDDCSPDFNTVRDYKTCSEKSCCKYYEPGYYQLDIYSLGIQEAHGFIPEKLEVCGIERFGNGFVVPRSGLTVGDRVWYIPRETDKARLEELRKYIINTASEISEYFKVFKKLNVK